MHACMCVSMYLCTYRCRLHFYVYTHTCIWMLKKNIYTWIGIYRHIHTCTFIHRIHVSKGANTYRRVCFCIPFQVQCQSKYLSPAGNGLSLGCTSSHKIHPCHSLVGFVRGLWFFMPIWLLRTHRRQGSQGILSFTY